MMKVYTDEFIQNLEYFNKFTKNMLCVSQPFSIDIIARFNNEILEMKPLIEGVDFDRISNYRQKENEQMNKYLKKVYEHSNIYKIVKVLFSEILVPNGMILRFFNTDNFVTPSIVYLLSIPNLIQIDEDYYFYTNGESHLFHVCRENNHYLKDYDLNEIPNVYNIYKLKNVDNIKCLLVKKNEINI